MCINTVAGHSGFMGMWVTVGVWGGDGGRGSTLGIWDFLGGAGTVITEITAH